MYEGMPWKKLLFIEEILTRMFYLENISLQEAFINEGNP
jgi:hypothetical protein